MGFQDRAVRTRARIVHAAATELDRAGYEGARLARVCELANVSMGALTFHFSSKGALAQAVREEGWAIVGTVVNRASPAGESQLHAAIDLTVALAELLEKDVVVRAAARVAREQPEAVGQWPQSWLPAVRKLLEQARRSGQLSSTDRLESVIALVVYLLAGAESQIRTGDVVSDRAVVSVADQLQQIWRLALRGVAAETSGTPPRKT